MAAPPAEEQTTARSRTYGEKKIVVDSRVHNEFIRRERLSAGEVDLNLQPVDRPAEIKDLRVLAGYQPQPNSMPAFQRINGGVAEMLLSISIRNDDRSSTSIRDSDSGPRPAQAGITSRTVKARNGIMKE